MMFEKPESKGMRIAIKYDAAIASLEPEVFELLLKMVHETAHIFTDTDYNTRTREYSMKMFSGFINEIKKYGESI